MGSGCLALFGLPFACVSVYMSWLLGSMLWLGMEAKSWEIVPAKIIKVELEESRNKESSTYQVLAEYQYSFQGKKYDADRVGLSTEKDNIGSYHCNLYERLKKARQGNKTVDCFVDPQDPTQSLLDRTIRPVMIAFMVPFVLGFGIVGFGLIGGAFYASRKLAAISKLEEANPEAPWLWREDWKRGVVESSANHQLMFMGIFTTLWGVISFPIAFIMLSDNQDNPWWVVLLVMLFPTVGVGLIAYVVLLLLRTKKFGASTFRLGNSPGLIGGKLTGVVMAPQIIRNAKSFKTKLVCTQTVSSGDDTKEKVLWQDSRKLKQTLSSDQPDRVGLPIVFTIPSDCLSTSGEDRIVWKLRVQAKTEGIDYDEEFEVPIFRTKDSQEGIKVDDEPLSPYEEMIPLNQQLAEQGIVVESLGTLDGIRYSSPIGRGITTSIGMTIFSMIWFGSLVFMFYQEIWFFVAIFALFGLLIAYITIDSWLGCSELSITDNQWKVRTGWYGFRGAGKEFSAADIRAINSKKKTSTGSGTNQTQWMNLIVQLEDGHEVTLIRHVLAGTSERQLLAELRHRAGLAEDGSPSAKAEDTGLWDYVN